jgi:hypothetical protein
MLTVLLSIRVVGSDEKAAWFERTVRMPHVAAGMTLFGVRRVPDACDEDETAVERLSWSISDPEVVVAHLTTDDNRLYANDEDRSMVEFTKLASLRVRDYADWSQVDWNGHEKVVTPSATVATGG